MPGLKRYKYIWHFYYTVVKLLDPLLAKALRHQASKQPNQRRVRVAVYNRSGDQVLLVKNVVGSKSWTFPGGGVERQESDAQAACRELEEELGLKFKPQDLTYLYTAEPGDENSGVRQLAPIFMATVDKESVDINHYRKIEIMDVIWTQTDNLPADSSQLVRTTVSRLP